MADIPDISFRSNDEYRLWERSLHSAKVLVELLEENQNNVVLNGLIFDALHEWVRDNGNFFNELIAEWVAEDFETNIKTFDDYTEVAADMVNGAILISDQLIRGDLG